VAGRGGLGRIWNATLYSRDGLRDAWRHEAAFRQELMLVAVLLPLGLYLGNDGVERALVDAGAGQVDVDVVFDPPWDPGRIGQAGLAELGSPRDHR